MTFNVENNNNPPKYKKDKDAVYHYIIKCDTYMADISRATLFVIFLVLIKQILLFHLKIFFNPKIPSTIFLLCQVTTIICCKDEQDISVLCQDDVYVRKLHCVTPYSYYTCSYKIYIYMYIKSDNVIHFVWNIYFYFLPLFNLDTNFDLYHVHGSFSLLSFSVSML